MRKVYRKILKKPSDNDILVQKLLLERATDSEYQLTCKESREMVKKGLAVADFTGTPEWCDPKLYQ